jgi:hypothetical protein
MSEPEINQPEKAFTPEAMADAAKASETLHADLLFGVDGAAAAPDAEQLYLAALAHLDLARRHFTLAQLAQTRALAGR